jgi:hypothetical protein
MQAGDEYAADSRFAHRPLRSEAPRDNRRRPAVF